MKKCWTLLPFCVIFLFLIFFPKESLASARTGLLLWFNTLLPSLLPFIILSDFFINADLPKSLLGGTEKFWKHAFSLSLEGAYALLLGIFCGYPMGAKITADLYKKHRISYQEACYLLSVSSNPGPSFVSAYVCIHSLNRPDLILPSFVILYTSIFLCSLIFRSRKHSNVSTTSLYDKEETSLSRQPGELLDVSIMNGFEAITKLGGYIILFSILQGILKQVFSPFSGIKYLIFGLGEITTGISAIAKSNLPFAICYPLVLSCTAFGGFCVAAQTKSMLAGTKLPLSAYLKGKLCCAIFTLLLAILIV